ncbi:hypothetical protein HBI22_161030 [Parastagonospora nodorum]|nr:hypothetical protein HBI22_161030 [Parastagonospora nodorum]
MMTLTFESPKADTHIHHHILPGFSETTNLASTRETSALDVRHLLFELSETTIFENTREKSISLDMKHTHLLPAAQHNHISIARTRHHSPVAHPTLHRLPDPVPRLSPTMQDHLHHLSLTAHTILNHHRDSSLDPAQNHPSRHQAWTRIRSVTPRKKVRWGGVEVIGDDGYVGSEER